MTMKDSLKKLVEIYQPNPKVIEAMGNIRILSTVGPTASGKTTIMKVLAASSPDFRFILDETSRPPRQEEANGVDFIFKTQSEILENMKAGELVQVALGPNGHLYCTRVSSYPLGIGLIALVPAAVRQFRNLPVKSFKEAFIVPKSYENWQNWLLQQAQKSGWDEHKKTERLQEAKTSYEFALADDKIHFVLNDNPHKAASRLKQVSEGKTPNDEAEAKGIAGLNYRELSKTVGTR